MKTFRNAVTAIFAMLLCAFPVHAQQVNPIFPTGPAYVLNNLVWGTTGTSFGFNNAWIFTPFNAGNGCVTVQVTNNNTTNAHTFQANLLETQNPTVPASFAAVQAWTSFGQTNQVGSSSVAANGGTFAFSGLVVGGTAQIALILSGGGTLAGSPDTATVSIVQNSGPCNLNQNSPGLQPGSLTNTGSVANFETTSAVNTAVSVSNFAVSGVPTRGVLFSVNARCSAGTAQLTIKDGATQIWSSAATEVGTTTFFRTFPVGLTSSLGNSLTVTLGTCGAANQGILDTQMSTIFVTQ